LTRSLFSHWAQAGKGEAVVYFVEHGAKEDIHAIDR